jgi:hypothetical protein
MRTALLLTCLILAAGCNPSPAPDPVVPPGGHGALRPPQGSLGYTDAEVDALRGKLRAIHYPQPPGSTLRMLGLESVRYSSLSIDDYKPNANNLLASHQKTYALNGREELVVIEDHFDAGGGRDIRKAERSAMIRPIAR